MMPGPEARAVVEPTSTALGAAISTTATDELSRLLAEGVRRVAYATTIQRATEHAFGCFPHASPAIMPVWGKQKRPERAASKLLFLLEKSGAGEGIRTLDPNLGKVVLYP